MEQTHRDIAKQAALDAYQQQLTNTFNIMFNNFIIAQGEADTNDAREKAKKGLNVAMKTFLESKALVETLPPDVIKIK